MIQFTVNSKKVTADVDEDMPLLWYIRDELALTGTKFGCGVASCGACTVHVDGLPVRSCSFPVSSAAGKKVTTIEAIGETKVGKAVQEAWAEKNVVQCGYCQSGQIMSATGLLSTNPKPSDKEIQDGMQGNVCRCATYVRIQDAVKSAAKKLGV